MISIQQATLSTIAVVFIILLPSSAIGQEEPWLKIGSDVPVLGVSAPVSLWPPAVLSASAGLVWSDTLTHPSSVEFIRLHIKLTGYEQAPTWFLLIRDSAGQVVDSYSSDTVRKLGGRLSVWSREIPGNTARIELYAAGALNGFRPGIDRYLYEAREPAKFSVIGAPNFEDIVQLSPLHKIYVHGLPIARLVFITPYGSQKSCTGFLVGEDLLLTNQHCVNTQETCDNTRAEFGFETGKQADSYDCKELVLPTVFVPTQAFDLALLRLERKMGEKPGSKWPRVKLSERAISDNEPLYIVQHPAWQTKRVTRVDCKTKGPALEGRPYAVALDFGHVCDTEGGSSGSPVFDLNDVVVGLHHWGIEEGAPNGVNQAVSMKQILAFLKGKVPDLYNEIMQ